MSDTLRPAPPTLSAPEVPPPRHVALKAKLAFGSGAFAEKIIFDADKQLANPIYNATLGVPPLWVGIGLAVPRFWDAVSDPVVGVISDKFQSRWGRRRPFILVGSVFTALFFIALWSMPAGMSHTFYFAYFVGLSLCFYTAATVWSVPFQALGYELADSYHERTRVQGFKAFFNAAGNLVTPWIFFFTQLSVFHGTLQGLRVVATLAGILILILGMLPALLIREPALARPRPVNRQPILRNLGAALRSRPFRLLLGTVVLIQIGGYMVAGLGFYVASYHMFGGDLKVASKFLGLYGTAFNGMVLLAAPIAVTLTVRFGKNRAFAFCCLLGLAGSLCKWFFFNPVHPWLAFLVPVFLAPGYACSTNLIFNSMVADICDVDELESGLRREGTYGAVGQWIFKMGQSASLLISNLVLVAVGFNVALGADQPAGVLTAIRACFSFVPTLAFLGALLLIRRYPITEAFVSEIRRRLALRPADADPA